MTRRMFSGLIGGASAALGSTASFVQHKILRRPYCYEKEIPYQDRVLYDCLHISGTWSTPLRVRMTTDVQEESVLEVTLIPRKESGVRILGVHGLRAQAPIKITLSANKPFQIHSLDAVFMSPGFKRENGMIVFNDPFYGSVPEDEFYPINRNHHRIASAEDITYGKTSPVGSPKEKTRFMEFQEAKLRLKQTKKALNRAC